MVWGLVHTARHVRGVRLARRVFPPVPLGLLWLLVEYPKDPRIGGRSDRRSRNRDEVVTR